MIAFHPLIGDVSAMKTETIEAKVNDITAKYFMTTNHYAREQMVALLDGYKRELSERRTKELASMEDSAKVNFGDLINVD